MKGVSLAWLLALAPVAPAQAPAEPEPDGVTLRVAGQRGGARFRPGAPLPFAADVGVPRAASGTGRLEIVRLGASSEDDRVLWRGDLDLAPGGVHRTLGLAAPLDGTTLQVEARWTSGGRTQTSRVPVTSIDDGVRWVLAVADTPETAAALGAVRPADAPGDWHPPWIVSTVDLSLLPPGWTAFAAADAVAVTCPPGELPGGILVGLTRFVEAGGTLLIGGGDRAVAIATALPGLPPVTPGPATATPIDPLARRFSRNVTSGNVLAAAATPGAGDIAMGGRDRPLLVVADRGAGQVAWLAFDPGEAPARDGGVASTVLDWLLARRDDVALRQASTDERNGYGMSRVVVSGSTWMMVVSGPGFSSASSGTGPVPRGVRGGGGNLFAAPMVGLDLPTPGREAIVWTSTGWCVLVIAVLWASRRRHRTGVAWIGLTAAALVASLALAWWAEAMARATLAARSLGLAVGALGARSAAAVDSAALQSPVGLIASLAADAPVECCATAHGWRPMVAQMTASGARAQIELPARSSVRVVATGLVDLGDGVTVEHIRDTPKGPALRVRNGTALDLRHCVVATAEGVTPPAQLAAGRSMEVVVGSQASNSDVSEGFVVTTASDTSAAEGLIGNRSQTIPPGIVAVFAIAPEPAARLRLAGRPIAIDGERVLALYGAMPLGTPERVSLRCRAWCRAACDPNDPTDTDLSRYRGPAGEFAPLTASPTSSAHLSVAATLGAMQFPAGVAFDMNIEFLGDLPFGHDLLLAPTAAWELSSDLILTVFRRQGWSPPQVVVEGAMVRDPSTGWWLRLPITGAAVRVDSVRQWLRGRVLTLRLHVSPALTDAQDAELKQARGVLDWRWLPRSDVLKVFLDRLALVPHAEERPR